MTKKYSLLFIAILVAGCATTPIPQIIVSYDKFKDQAQIKTSPVIVLNPDVLRLLGTSASYLCKGGTSCKTEYIYINFVSQSYHGWQYLTSRDLIFIADNQRINLGEAIRVGDVAGGTTIELLSVIVPVDVFRKIANSQSLEGKLGTTVFAISYEDRVTFRMLLARVDKSF
jgi:hypothetical protein